MAIRLAPEAIDTEANLEEKDDLFRTVAERCGSGLIIFQGDRIIYANSTIIKMVGVTGKQILAMDPFEMVHPEDREMVRTRAFQRLEGVSPPDEYEFRVISQDGETKWVRLLATLLGYKGKPAILGALIDITAQKSAEQALQEKDLLNRALLDSIPNPAMLIRKDRFILAANHAAAKMGAKVGGYCWRELGWGQFIPEKHRQYLEKHGGPPPAGIHCTFCLADQAMKTRRALNNPELRAFGQVWDAWWVPVDQKTYLHYAVNITVRNQAEKQLKRSEERYRLLVESMKDGFVIQNEKGVISFANYRFSEMSGYSPDELMGKSLADFLDDGKRRLLKVMGNQKASEASLEVSIRRKDGREARLSIVVSPLLDESGRYKGNFAIVSNITELAELRRQAQLRSEFQGLVGSSPQMRKLFEEIKEGAPHGFPVLIQGESGTGKELVARAIHNLSSRSSGVFVPVNIAALPETLLETELFLHVRGAFTGAVRDKKGRFELADKGTVFLDEVAELTPTMQVKLLRILQEGTFERLGDNRTIKVDLHVISATNRDLEKEMKTGRFREDLFYRLCVMTMNVPPLRERVGEIPLLAVHFLARLGEESREGEVSISPEALSMLVAYPWPGNVRELQNAVQFAFVKSKGQRIEPAHLPSKIFLHGETKPRRSRRRKKIDEKSLRTALARARGDKVKAAKILGVSRATLYRYLSEENT